MANFSKNQVAFLKAFSSASGINPGVAAAWMAAEQPVGSSAGDHGTQNWLNIGNTDSGSYGVGANPWKDPVSAGIESAKWLKGQVSVPGFGHAAPGIVAITKVSANNPMGQIAALQHSGWASSGYPDLPGLYSTYGRVGQKLVGSVTTSTGTTQAAVTSQARKRTAGSTTTSFTAGGGQPDIQAAGLAAMLAAGNAPIDTSGKFKADNLLGSFADNVASGQYLTPKTSTASSTTTPGAVIKTAKAKTGQVKMQGMTGNPNLDVLLKQTGVTNFGGQQVAKWIAPILTYLKAHGWTGGVNSGYRSYADQKRIYDSGVRPAAVPGTSNHEGDVYPKGAVDLSQAQQAAAILAKSPYAKILVYAGAKDPVHFSHPHDGGY